MLTTTASTTAKYVRGSDFSSSRSISARNVTRGGGAWKPPPARLQSRCVRSATMRRPVPGSARRIGLRQKLMAEQVEKLVIIGSGPAGWTAAIYAARANLRPAVIEGALSEDNRLRGTLPLGQLNLTTEVENFPGFPHGVMGPDLMLKMREQAERYGTRIVTEDVVGIDLKRRPFTMTDSAGVRYASHAVIIATGASANYIGLDSESRFKNMG